MTFGSPAFFGDATPDAVVVYPVFEESKDKRILNIKKEPWVYLMYQKN